MATTENKKCIQQFYFRGIKDCNPEIPLPNNGQNIDEINNDWINNLIKGKNCYKLGISATPGVQFHLNGLPDVITVDYTGVFELDFTNLPVLLSGLSFTAESLKMIDKNDVGVIYVDIAYTEGGSSN